MKKKNKKKLMLLITILMMLPMRVLASESLETIPLGLAFGMEIFITPHWAIFFQYPFSSMISPSNPKKTFIKIFIARILLVFILTLFVSPNVAIFDFISLFIGAFIIVPATCFLVKDNMFFYQQKLSISKKKPKNTLIYRCKNCNKKILIEDTICPNCGKEINGNNMIVEKQPLKCQGVNIEYYKNENDILKNIVKREIINLNLNYKYINNKTIVKNKYLICMMFILLTILNILSYFFIYNYSFAISIEIILIFIFAIKYKNVNIISNISKLAKKNPDMDIKEMVKQYSTIEPKKIISPIIMSMPILIIAVLFIFNKFKNPIIIYKKIDNYYNIIDCSKTINKNNQFTIPSKYKGKQIVAISEKAFSNTNIKKIIISEGIRHIDERSFIDNDDLETINIPSTVIEIRTEAFKNNSNLKEVNIKYGLKSIASNAFENCYNLEKIELPESVDNLGQNVFKGCEKLNQHNEGENNYDTQNV